MVPQADLLRRCPRTLASRQTAVLWMEQNRLAFGLYRYLLRFAAPFNTTSSKLMAEYEAEYESRYLSFRDPLLELIKIRDGLQNQGGDAALEKAAANKKRTRESEDDECVDEAKRRKTTGTIPSSLISDDG
jgi:hypothetical protein